MEEDTTSDELGAMLPKLEDLGRRTDPTGQEYPQGYYDNIEKAKVAINAACDYAKSGE